MPLLEAAREAGTLDDLQPARHPRRLAPRPAKLDERASVTANALFDAVLVHADPRFARLEESFHPTTPLRVPVHYTGFVLRRRPARARADPAPGRRPRVVVSAGGGASARR